MVAQIASLKFHSNERPNLSELVATFHTDLLPSITSAFQKIINSMSEPESQQFVKIIIDEFEAELKKSHPHLQIFLSIISSVCPKIADADYLKALELFFVSESKAVESSAFDLAVQAVRSLLHAKQKQVKEITNFTKIFLSKNKGSITPLICLGECAALGETASEVETTLLSLVENEDPAYHLKVAKQIRPLMSFFKNPRQRVEESLA